MVFVSFPIRELLLSFFCWSSASLPAFKLRWALTIRRVGGSAVKGQRLDFSV